MDLHMEWVPHATPTMTQLQFALTEQELHLLLLLTRTLRTPHSVTTPNNGAQLKYLLKVYRVVHARKKEVALISLVKLKVMPQLHNAAVHCLMQVMEPVLASQIDAETV